MTIIYQNRVATTSLGGFLKLLRAWKGSVYKLLYKELTIFITLYALISLVYRLALTPDQQKVFERIVMELRTASSLIPLSFLLGFYVTFIVNRWWQQFINVPWPDRKMAPLNQFITLLLPDRTLFVMATYLHGFDDKSRMMRRSVARYVLFGLILICRAVSVSVMKRFPTIDHIVEAGFITKEEADLYEKVQCRYLKFWVPMMWANQVLVTARREGRIQTDFGLRMVIEYLADFRDKCSLCFVYDWITVPLVYTQVVTFATYSYFAVALLGQQYLDISKKYPGYEGDYYIPGFTILQFLFYMGWLKVAEQMINPFGEDDDDYDINWLIDRHTSVAFCLTDQCYGKHPNLIKDPFWDDLVADVPYTESSLGSFRPNFLGTTSNLERPSLDVEKMVIADHEDITQHQWTGKPRGKSSITGSLLSLLHPRQSTRHHHGSQATLESTGSGHGRQYTIPSRKVSGSRFTSAERSDDDELRRSSVELPVKDENSDGGDHTFQLRQRANTDSEFLEIESKNRKLSLPFHINHVSKPKSKLLDSPLSQSPKVSRFTVEHVKDTDSESDSAPSKTRRQGQVIAPFQNIDKVSRIPELSAIEEGNTITSLCQLMGANPMKRGSDSSTGFQPANGEVPNKNSDDLNNNVGIKRQKSKEPHLLDIDEDYATAASEHNSPVYPYFDAVDTVENVEECLLGRRRNASHSNGHRTQH
ncbi:bestrophin-4-like isoform X2 [Physella acuta]|uniref:bestrophin-4-like isoform X2 n=1 Tax=Physella acuta TaxID=109671 RepID=UPI0027DD0CB9|nr:bestrophin-4-like isoform X2 [Physella acuta]